MAFLTALATPATKKRTTSFAKTPPRYASATKSLFKTPRAASAQKKSRKSMDKVNEESVKVAVRIRPLSSASQIRAFHASSSQNSIIETLDSKPTTTPRRHSHYEGTNEYSYDNVFGEETDTTSIYGELVKDIVASVSKEGINGTVFTYGQTSSGKTFTMQGSGDSTSGIIQMAAHDIFETIRLEKNESQSESTVKVSYVEIYNEELRDLLADSKTKSVSLTIREDKHGSITVENLKEVVVHSLEQLMEVFRAGEANKSIGSTKMNDRSSRSHAILKITIEKKTTFNTLDEKENTNVNASPVVKTSSSLNLVDLAGSESIRLTGATGMQKKEGGMINQSLLALSKVLTSLGQKNPGYVNYRDSNLTRILKPSLSGNARMAVICCISPSAIYIDETRSTLQFATRAKLVKTNAAANEVVECQADVIAKLQMDLEKSRLINESLKTQIHKLQSEAASTVTQDEYNGMKRELDNLKTFLFDGSNQKGHKRVSSFSAVHDTSNHHESTVKDDICVSFGDNEAKLLRLALAGKARQVQELQEEIHGSQNELINAKYRIAYLEHQVEDLFAKLELTDEHVNQLEEELSKTGQCTVLGKEDATSRMKAMKAELEDLKPTFKFGDQVYSAWWPDKSRLMEPAWYPGVITGCRETSSGDGYGPTRSYEIKFDDGDKLDNVEDYYVFSRADYLLTTRKWIGVRNKVDLTASDEWARITGYYIAKIDGKDEPFAFLSDALRAVDSHTVTVLGTQTKEKDLNLPEEWIFTESLPLKKEDAEILDKLPINLHHDNERKKKSRCGSCTACLRGNCGKCTNCRDKSKKKACEKRKCPYMSYGERKKPGQVKMTKHSAKKKGKKNRATLAASTCSHIEDSTPKKVNYDAHLLKPNQNVFVAVGRKREEYPARIVSILTQKRAVVEWDTGHLEEVDLDSIFPLPDRSSRRRTCY